MRSVAVIQAGGRGMRMQRSTGETSKPLVAIRGVPLLERSLVALLRAGQRDVVVIVPAGVEPLAAFVDGRCRSIARAFGATVERVDEAAPRGTIGSVSEVARRADVALVVNSDNLTTLDLAAMLRDHAASRAAMTIAVHDEPFFVPYGVVDLEGDRVVGYREKPALPARVCSAISVLGRAALDRIPASGSCHLPDVVLALVASGETVHAHLHRAPWVDVNEARDVDRAETLLARHADEFERMSDAPALEVAGALIRSGDALLLERRSADAKNHPGLWDTPGGKLEPGESPAAAIARELREELGLSAEELGLAAARPRPVATFDDVDLARSTIVRHHVFELEVARSAVAPRVGEFRWIAPQELAALQPLNQVVGRSLAAAAQGKR